MIQIRTGVPADLQFIAKSQIDMAQESEGLRLDPLTVDLGVRAVFEDARKGTYYIATGGDGTQLACLLTVPEWSDWRNGDVLWIHSVYTIPEARRRGVFQALYQHLKTKVDADVKLRGLRLYVERKNNIAQQVYEAMGMTKEHYELYEWLK